MFPYKGDIWSFGLSLWAVCAGKKPWIEWDPETKQEEDWAAYDIILMQKIQEKSPNLHFREDVFLSDDFKDFLSHALEPEPHTRWSAEQLLQHKWIKTRATGNVY